MVKNVIERAKENNTDRKIADFKVKQAQSYSFKKKYAAVRAWEFYNHPDIAGNCYVAVGGLDSITLLLFLRSIGINVPAVSVSALEDKSIQAVHKQLGVQTLKPLKSKVEVIREFGWPVLSKEIAGKISLLQNPSEKNATVRHAIITGETGAYGGYRKGTRMKLAQKWLEKFGGYENEREGVDYKKPDFLVSEKCCYYLKERPCDIYAKETGQFPYMGLMASEGGRRQKVAHDKRVQLHIVGDKEKLSLCHLLPAGPLDAGPGIDCSCAGNLRGDRVGPGWNTENHKSPADWVFHVRLWNPPGEAPPSL